VSNGDGGNLSADQYERLKGELEAGFTGAARAGRPLLLEGGLDWKSMSLTPKDMDFLEAKNGAAREIALAFGVPPMLLGIPGDNTYANYQEANRAFWRGTVLPLVGRIAGALGGWLAPAFGDGGVGAGGARRETLRLWFDADQVDALSADREALWSRVAAADFLTVNEKRAAVGYGEVEGGDNLATKALKAGFNPNQPRVPAGSGEESGRWTLAARSTAKDRCIELCYRLLERPEPPGTSLINYWDFQKCLNKCMGVKNLTEDALSWTSTSQGTSSRALSAAQANCRSCSHC
jgi:hypothetical protein